MRVAIFATMPKDTYSGGRYYSLMLAEALASRGHEIFFCTNNQPVFFSDLNAYPEHDSVDLILTQDFSSNLPTGDFDAVFLTPGTSIAGFYDRVELFCIDRNARLVFINFESGDWFNALSPSPRPLSDWASWKKASEFASVVLSISQEGNTWARGFYKDCESFTRFDYCYPPINTIAADSVTDVEEEDRILLFMRFSTSSHKGADQLDRLFCDAMAGFTLVIVLGKEEIPTTTLERLFEVAKQFDVRLETKRKLSDVGKYREIRRAKLVLFPSYFEGFGYPPVEAQYCERNCVAFDLPVLRETCSDRLYLSKSGNWSEFRERITDALNSPRDTSGFRQSIAPIASLQTASERLESILEEVLQNNMPSRATRRNRLRVLQFLRINDFRLRVRQQTTRTRNFVLRCASAIVRGAHKFRRKSRRVCYYPIFNSMAELTSHYYRAQWYLPYVERICNEVLLYQSCSETVGARPDYMAAPPVEPDHVHLRRGKLRNLLSLLTSDLILVWKKDHHSKYVKFLARFCGIRVVNIATNDIGSREYGEYCAAVWTHLASPEDRELILAQNRERFRQIADEIQTEKIDRACVFGTGPSLAKAAEFDYGHSLNIVCNSIVQNYELLDLLKPRFICAGDVVSHLGVSTYAHQFRQDLISALRERDTIFVTTANFGALILYHYPEITDKVLLIPQASNAPVFDLLEHFGTPRLDSTLNIHMLPLAATFSKSIWLLGCDGKSDAVDNEDFWPHAEAAQYRTLVDAGHSCHPTFNLNRQLSTYDRFLESTVLTVEAGEQEHGIKYSTLSPSNIPILRDKLIER